jgi:hypothetical protein
MAGLSSLRTGTVTGTGPPLNRLALLRVAASGVGVKLPSTTTPLAWLARIPGWRPQSWFMTSTVCVAVVPPCAQATAAGMASRTPATMVVARTR